MDEAFFTILRDNVLNHMDVTDLVKLQRTSKKIYDILTATIENKCKWYEKCLKEIPENFWSSLLKYQNDPEICYEDFHKSKKDSPIWMKMYESWNGWSNLTERTSSTKTLEISQDNFINTMDVLSDTIVVGDYNGGVMFFDISNANDEPFIHQTDCHFVSQIRLCRKGDRIMAVAFFDEAEIRIQCWDVKSKELIWEKSYESTEMWIEFVASYEFYCTLDQFPDKNNRRILTVKRFGVDEPLKVVHSLQIMGEPEELIYSSSFMDRDKVLVVTKDRKKGLKIYEITQGNYIVPDIETFPSKSQLVFTEILNLFVVALRRNCSIIGFYITDGTGWKYHDTTKDFPHKLSIESILYHVGLLILGLTSGEVCIIQIGEIERGGTFFRENINNAKRKTLKLDSEAIKFLKVTEYNSNQYIVAATEKKLHIVKFD